MQNAQQTKITAVPVHPCCLPLGSKTEFGNDVDSDAKLRPNDRLGHYIQNTHKRLKTVDPQIKTIYHQIGAFIDGNLTVLGFFSTFLILRCPGTYRYTCVKFSLALCDRAYHSIRFQYFTYSTVFLGKRIPSSLPRQN